MIVEKEMIDILEEMSKENAELGLIAKVVYCYGRTLDEVVSLKLSDIDFESETIMFHVHSQGKKTPIRCSLKGNRGCVLNKLNIMKSLQYYNRKNQGDPLFLKTAESSIPSKKRIVQRFLYKYNLTSQGLRKMRGIHLYEKGVGVESIQELYLHKERSTTIKYLGLKKEKLALDRDFIIENL